MAKLRCGYFIAPFHRAGTNPTLALQRHLEFVEHLDALGYDEAWIGEHHSAGSEIISSPEVFIAAAAERAKRIRFGTGVISLAYHNPLWAADRLMLLDHLTHGRIIGGVGPGSLPTDSAMIGLTPTDTRELLETNLDIVVRLLAGEKVTAKTPTHELFNAQLQLAPYSEDGIPLAVAAVASPTGARLAGKHGIGLLSIGATLVVEGFDALAHHWASPRNAPRRSEPQSIAETGRWSVRCISPRLRNRRGPTSASASHRGSTTSRRLLPSRR
jgi:limonene 1,2-monooxygenase